MNTHQTANGYAEYLERAVRLAEFYSARHWSALRAHDPGLTILQILTNALALAHERNHERLRSPGLFRQAGERPARWKEPAASEGGGAKKATEQAGQDASGQGGQRLLFQPRLEPPSCADFVPMPSSRVDIRAAVERIPGLRKAWFAEDGSPAEFAAGGRAGGGAGRNTTPEAGSEGTLGTGQSKPRLLLEFAPVLSLYLPESISEALEFGKESGSAGGKNGRQRRNKKRLLREAARLLSAGRGLGQPVLECREARPAGLVVEIDLEGADDPSGGGAGFGAESSGRHDFYRTEFQSALAALMLAVERGLRGDESPPRLLEAAELLTGLRAEAELTGELAAVGLALLGLRLAFDEPELAEQAAASPGTERGEAAPERVELPDEFDCFRVAAWRVNVIGAGGRAALPEGCVDQAAGLAGRRLVDYLWRERWRRNTQAQAEPVGPGGGRSEAPPRDFLFAQFPDLYRLKRALSSEKSVREESGELSGVARPDPAEALQLHGWLLLFEQLLADAGVAFEEPEKFFSPVARHASSLVADSGHPLLDRLAGPDLAEKQAAMLRGERFYLERCRSLLLHLAALQGEEPWFAPEDLRLEDEHGRMLAPERSEYYNRLLAVWLRALPRLNGRRLLRRWHEGGNFLESGGLSPLEERISMLLLPCQAAWAEARRGEDEAAGPMGESGGGPGGGPHGRTFHADDFLIGRGHYEMRKFGNALTGRNEYRCYIRDSGGGLRIVCTLLSPTPERAELTAATALRLAALPEHYHLEGGRVRIGWLAELHDPENPPAAVAAANGQAERLNRLIRDTVQWARAIQPPWVCVLDYTELGENRPFELAVLVEAELVPPRRRASMAGAIRAHVPAHLLPRLFFVSPARRRLADTLLHAPDSANYESLHARYAGLLKLLKELEDEAAGASRAGPGPANEAARR